MDFRSDIHDLLNAFAYQLFFPLLEEILNILHRDRPFVVKFGDLVGEDACVEELHDVPEQPLRRNVVDVEDGADGEVQS